MIDIKNITKSFGPLQVLKGIDLHINAREVVSIVGPSGAGKTTLLQIMGTLDKPDQGTIRINGVDVSSLSKKKLSNFRNQHIGFVFQFHQLLPEFTAMENVMIPAFIAGKSYSEAQKNAVDLLTFMGLADRASHKPAELSGGEKQRVAVARALINQPAVIFADEPSGSLDTKNKNELHQLFFDLRDRFGQTFVIVTHDEDLARLTDRTIHMKDGVILVNTGRGGLIDTNALIRGILSGKIGACGLDVYEEENPNVYKDRGAEVFDSVTSTLCSFPNVVMTSHQAFFTHEALSQIAQVTLDNATAFAEGTDYVDKSVVC